MVKLILLVAVGYIFYRALKTWLMTGVDRPIDRTERGQVDVDDVLVQDPVCKTYIAQRSSIHLRRGSETIHFCIEQCRDRDLEAHPEEHR